MPDKARRLGDCRKDMTESDRVHLLVCLTLCICRSVSTRVIPAQRGPEARCSTSNSSCFRNSDGSLVAFALAELERGGLAQHPRIPGATSHCCFAAVASLPIFRLGRRRPRTGHGHVCPPPPYAPPPPPKILVDDWQALARHSVLSSTAVGPQPCFVYSAS